MKRFVAALLATAMFLTMADFSFIDLSPIAAHAQEAVTDAYDAYTQLRNANYNSLNTAVSNANAGERDTEQNEQINRHAMIFGDVAGGIARPGGWGSNPAGATTSPGYGTPAKFNQTGIDGTAQVKSGEWLNDTTYDATAGTPTTENLFVNVGGTQYLVDIDYEYVYRPYIRRYHFSASVPNYRYYAFEDNKSLWSEQKASQIEWEAISSTDWEHNLAYPGSGGKVKERSALFYGNDDLRKRNTAYLNAVGLQVNSAGTALEKKPVTYISNQSAEASSRRGKAGVGSTTPGIDHLWDPARYPEEQYRYDNWYDCGYNRVIDKDTMSPGMAAAISFKKQVAEAIEELKKQYATIDDNYRADQGAYNVDGPDTDVDDWMLDDYVSWMYTYYGMVRRDAHGSGVAGDGWDERLTQFADGNSTNYESENVWHPIIVSYLQDWDSYGAAGLNREDLEAKQDSATYVSALSNGGSGLLGYTPGQTAYQALQASMAQIVAAHTGAGDRYTWSDAFSVPISAYQNRWWFVLYNRNGKTLLPGGDLVLPSDIPNSDLSTYSWHNELQLYLDAVDNIEKYAAERYYDMDFYHTWLCNIDSNAALLSNYSTGSFQSNLGADQLGASNISSDSNKFSTNNNQLHEVYLSSMWDLFVSVSGLFYTDELEDLFGGTYNFPGLNKSGVSYSGVAQDKCVAQNLYWLFGVPIENGENEPLKLEKSWSLPWAVFPVGGDLDGAMEDSRGSSAPARMSNGDVAINYSDDDFPAQQITPYEFYAPMCVSPQFVKYTKFDFYVELTSKDDPMHYNNGFAYWYKYHDKSSSHDTHSDTGEVGASHSSGDKYVCELATQGSPPSGYGPHGCSWCDDCDAWKSTSCSDGPCGDPDCDDTHHDAGDDCTEDCAYHWHSACNQDGYVKNERELARDHGSRVYKEYVYMNSYSHPKMYVGNDDSVTGSGDSLSWTEQYPTLSYNETIAQTFKNVRYLNIISYSIWEYDRAEVRGLGHLLATPVNTVTVTNSAAASEDLIVTEALSSMGYSTYDIDEADINRDVGAHGINGSTKYWNNLEIKGRVANSFHEDSLGAIMDPYRATLSSTHDVNDAGSGAKYNTIADITFINTSDVPALNYYGTVSPYTAVRHRNASGGAGGTVSARLWYRNFVNGDRTAFHLQNSSTSSYSDDLYFTYSPLTQGGRSHSTFNGFIAQALARTLYSYVEPSSEALWSSGSLSRAVAPKIPYSNSLRIQGDYLAIRDIHGNTNTIVGSMYDTWDERELGAPISIFGTDNEIRVNKFNILKVQEGNHMIPLAQYLTADGWVMGSMSYILSRQPYYLQDVDTLSGSVQIGCTLPGSGINCFTNCWMIHTYSKGINKELKTFWDAYYDQWGLYVTQQSASFGSPKGQLGNINYYRGTDDYGVDPGSLKNRKGDSVRLRDSMNDRYRPLFTLPDGTISTEVILNYSKEGNNAGENFANWSNQRTSNLVTNTANPLQYIGYQSEGDGTKNIVETGDNVTTQTGFTDSDVGKVFNADKTMVTDASGDGHNGKGTYRDEGGFQRYGINTITGSAVYRNGRDIVLNEDQNIGNVHPLDNSNFSRWYPWLSDVNVSRYLPNGRYYSSQIYNVYRNVVRDADGGVGGTYDYNRVPFGTNEVRINTHYTRSGSSIGGTDSDTLPNSLVMYNPATTFTAHLVDPSDYMPDGTNYGIADTGNRRYLAGYGEGFGKLILRDQRVGRHTSYGSEGTEDYTSKDGVLTVTGQTSSTSYHYEMRYHDVATQNFMYYESLIETKAYTMEDYDVKTNHAEIIDLDTTSENRYHEFTEKQTVKMVTKDSHGSYHAATVEVNPGDRITWEDSAAVLTRGSDNFTLEYSAFQEAFKQMQLSEGVKEEDLTNTVDFIPMTRGIVMNPVNATFEMKKGSVIEFSIPITDVSGNNTSECLQMELPDSFAWKYTVDGLYHTFYIEALEDAVLTNITMTALTDYRIQAFSGSAIKAHNILLLALGIGSGETQVPVEGVTTLNYYYSSQNYSVNSTNRWGSYNTMVVDISGSYEFFGVDIHVFELNHIYMQNQNGTISISLDQSDPHKVPNTNWRYYVLGWKTEYGEYISSVYDPALAEGSTVRLIPPIGATDDNYLDAVTLDNMAMNNQLGVGRYGNNFYLIKLAGNTGGDQYTYTLDWYGMKISEFDTISFGEETTKTYGTLVSWEQTSEQFKTQVFLKSYELVFRCSWGTITKETEISIGMYATCTREIRAYDVKYSGNLEHKISMELDVRQEDWVRVADIVNETVISTLQSSSGDYISLDDEFVLYWDNMVDLVNSNQTTESRHLTTTLGRGWDVNTDDSENVNNNFTSLKNNPSGMFKDIWGTDMTDAQGRSKYTDTTKWIYSKYVTFNVDMYGFTEGTAYTLQPSYDPKNPGRGDTSADSIRQFDPTTPAYNESAGKYNNLVYIPAGTPVHLGYYLGDDSADNSGEFIDYGYNIGGTTKDPNGDNYVYHFWCPLSVGESDSQVVAEFHVTTINNGDTGAGNQAAWNWGNVSRYLRGAEAFAGLDTAEDDEWGNDILKVGSTFNKDNLQRIDSLQLINNSSPDVAVSINRTSGVYTRYNTSYNTAIMSVAGRVGALTVVDSGDPRYQDTFKNPTNNSDYAITPIVLAVLKYTNDETPANAPGSQNRYLTDASDIRGRLGRMPSIAVMYNLRIPFNTYGTQWFKEVCERFWLPMGKDFNIHSDSDLPEQRLGYELYCSLETIGNYYGSSRWRLDSGEDPSNLNDDYGQTKIQIRPYYVYLDTETGETTALDVYMRRNGNYVLLNAGSKYSSATENANEGGNDPGPYWIDASHYAYYTMSIKSNTNVEWNNTVEKTYRLDQTLLRRMVTKREAETTYYVMYTDKELTNNPAVKNGITETLLEPFELDTSSEEDLLDYSYYYGNTQIEFLREQNRTFIGGVNDYIKDSKETNWTNRAKRYGQKWHFGLGLPASSIFVKHGSTQFNSSTIINGRHGVILVCIDVYAIGEKWVLHYQSELSNEGITVDGHEFSVEDWKVYPEQVPNMIPVSMYRADQLAPNDIDDRGTY